MAMNGDILGQQIIAAIDGELASQPTANAVQREAIWKAVGRAIVLHIQTSGAVTVTVASVSGVTVGPGVSGPGAGTGTIL